MGLRIQNNIAALNAHRQLQISDSGLSKSLERLSSGYRINRATDDAAGLAISQQFRADIASYKVASRNASEAGSLLQVAEGALDQMGNMLTRLKELATQASSANAGSNVAKIDAEAQELIDEIDRIATSTKYAGTNLINGTFGVGISSTSDVTLSDGVVDAIGMTAGQSVTVQVSEVSATAGTYDIEMTYNGNTQKLHDVSTPGTGEQDDVYFAAFGIKLTVNSSITGLTAADELVADNGGNSSFQIGAENEGDNQITFSIGNARSSELGNSESTNGLTDIDLETDATTALDIVDAAIDDLTGIRGDIGANQNRLMYASANLSVTIENVTASESVIRDVDMAAEMTTFTKNQILLQAGTAMLAQANMAPQQVLSLFG
jgi:flagellin